jgi:hypothetical protein
MLGYARINALGVLSITVADANPTYAPRYDAPPHITAPGNPAAARGGSSS